VVVRKARRDALNALTTQGVQVFAAPSGTVNDVLQRLLEGGLTPMRAASANEQQPASRAEGDGDLSPDRAAVGPGGPMNAQVVPIAGLGLQVVSTPRGLQVVSVASNSSAQRAGIDRGDLILAVNRASLTDPAQLQALAPGMPPFWALVERHGMRAELWIVP
jgi:S1-C subfamily serine protease